MPRGTWSKNSREHDPVGKGERPKVGNNATGMDTLQVVSGLEAYFVTLQAEVDEIGRDMQNCQVLNNKYGRFWSPGLNSLQQLKAVKEQQLKDISFQFDLFNLHLDSGRSLLSKLQKTGPPVSAGKSAAENLTVEADSSILANSVARDALDGTITIPMEAAGDLNSSNYSGRGSVSRAGSAKGRKSGPARLPLGY